MSGDIEIDFPVGSFDIHPNLVARDRAGDKTARVRNVEAEVAAAKIGASCGLPNSPVMKRHSLSGCRLPHSA